MNAERKQILRLAAEFAVIVVGVLVALFVESAWEGLQDRGLAAQYRERLAEELAANQEALALDRTFTAENCRASQAALDSQEVLDAVRRIPGIVQQLGERTYRSCNLARFHDEYEARLNAMGEALDAAR